MNAILSFLPYVVSALGVAFSAGIAIASLRLTREMLEREIRSVAALLSQRIDAHEKADYAAHVELGERLDEHRETLHEHDARLQKKNARITTLEAQVGSLREMRRVKEQ